MEKASVINIDTLAIFQRLKKTSLQEDAAQEITEVIKDTMESNLVTKTDLDVALARIKADMDVALARTKADMVRWVAGLLVAQAAVIVALGKLL